MASTREDLIKDALTAIRETLQGEKLTSSICTVAVVGVGESFHILDQATVQQLIDSYNIVGEDEGAAPAEQEPPAAEEGAAPAGDQEAAPMDI